MIDRALAIGAAVIAAVLALCAGVQTVRVDRLKRELVGVQARYDRAVAAANAAALDASTQYRALEQRWREDATNAERIRQTERDALARAIAAMRADGDRLRDDIAGYARGRDAADDTLAACRERTETLGRLLGGYVQTDADNAEDLESLAADLRAVLNSWPR